MKKWILFKLFVLSALGMNKKKANVIREANIYKKFGEGGIIILVGYLPILS